MEVKIINAFLLHVLSWYYIDLIAITLLGAGLDVMHTSVPSSDIDDIDEENKEDERVPNIMSRSTPAHVSMFCRSPIQFSGRSTRS